MAAKLEQQYIEHGDTIDLLDDHGKTESIRIDLRSKMASRVAAGIMTDFPQPRFGLSVLQTGDHRRTHSPD
jgi:hypothetical protein